MNENKKRGIYLILAGAVLFAVSMVFMYANRDAVPSETATSTATTTELAATTTDIFAMEPIVPEAKVSTEGWKTCRNEEYGWEVRYPGDWYVYGEGHTGTTTVLTEDERNAPGEVEGLTWGLYYRYETPCVGVHVLIAEWEPGTGFASIEGLSVSIDSGEEVFGSYRSNITNIYDLAYSYQKNEIIGLYLIDDKEAVWMNTPTISSVRMYYANKQLQLSTSIESSDTLQTMLSTLRFFETTTTPE